MTRKCVLCKETNYRNTYSFFSAPKDPETRKKWQNAIAIENYAVSDDTYVCSKHFHKDDIITHWVSGVPPHVITIKYKKCRLRPGAVPGRNYHLEENTEAQENSDDSDINIGKYSPLNPEKSNTMEEEETNVFIPVTEEKLQISNNENHKIIPLHCQFSSDFNGYNYISKRNSLSKMELSENGLNISNMSHDESEVRESSKRTLNQTKQNKIINSTKNSIIPHINSVEDIKFEDERKEQDEVTREIFYSNTPKTISESSSKSYKILETDDTLLWEHKTMKKDTPSKEKLTDNDFKIIENVYIENQILNNFNYNDLEAYYPTYNIDENEMLFEDLLEVCTEVLLPRGWSCLVTSKGHTTTIVYLYMGMTKGGMPFTEKQVFIKSDMILHCAAVNREINPLVHNLIKEGKHLKVQNLLDIEELIDEFDQRIVCQGIYNTARLQETNRIKVAYKDGIKWRHILCPLIINNDSPRCTRCISLSHTLQRKSKNFPVFSHNSSIFTRQQQKMYSIRQKYKHI
ncbi:hypothetical protein WH47_04641 [Habropoda laboriosa]|uniref:THAP-type domain-containing protein n=1 Tax=Habropoda laboriosa TaxID=597456 RepID=A0A0L7R2P9_9HYME|nr:PREDICTED: uncharacterized protein LOC108572759 [Habropoda laboriosa]KOC65051.1 hypothetical protein WH47_04641 [Habropoda laboriosa]